MPACDRRTDRQTDGQTDILPRHGPRYAYASRGQNFKTKTQCDSPEGAIVNVKNVNRKQPDTDSTTYVDLSLITARQFPYLNQQYFWSLLLQSFQLVFNIKTIFFMQRRRQALQKRSEIR